MARLLEHYKKEVVSKLKEEFGYTPKFTTREAFHAWRLSQGL